MLCRQTTARVPDMFCNFYLVKNHKFCHNSTTKEPKERISTELESFGLQKIFDECLNQFKKKSNFTLNN